MKYADYMRQIGKPLHITEPELAELRRHLRRLYNRGMSYAQIAASAPGEHNETSVAKIVNEWSGATHRDLYVDLMKATFEVDYGRKTGRRMDSTGVRRRLRALVAAGFGYNVLGELMDCSAQAIYQLVKSEAPAHSSTVARVCMLYDKIAYSDPFDYGATMLGVSRAKGVARRNGWAPVQCWDEDTVDDPAAHPEWTGACGTPRGFRIHYRDGILPVCQPCKDARAEHLATLNRGRGGREAIAEFNRDKFIAVRTEKGYTVRALAQCAGVDEQCIGHWEKGRSKPTAHTLEKILRTLDVSWEDVCDETSEAV